MLLDQLDRTTSVVDRGADLALMAHDPRITQQAFDVGLPERRDTFDVETRERLAEVLTLPQDRQPREA